MEVLGLQEIAVSSLKLPGDFRRRLKDPGVAELGSSYDSVGQLHEPIVRAEDKLLIAGGDRVAAHVLRRAEKVLVKLVVCTDEEAEYIRHTENVRRRHEPDKRARDLERMLALESARQAQLIEDHRQGRAPEPPKTPKGRNRKPIVSAREGLAKRKGIKPKSVEQAQWRAKVRREKAEAVEKVVEAQAEGKVVDTKPISPIDDLGFSMTADWLAKVAEVKRLLELASQRASDALGALTQLTGKELPFPEARVQRLREDAKALATAVRMTIPSSLCPFCKGQDAYQDTCTGCVGHGYITAGQMDHVPEAAWAQDVVLVNGKVVKLDLAEPGTEPDQPLTAAVKVESNVGDLGGGW